MGYEMVAILTTQGLAGNEKARNFTEIIMGT